MSWSISASGNHEAVTQQIRDYTPPPDPSAPPADPNATQRPDAQLIQANAVKSALLSFLDGLSDADKDGTFNVSVSGHSGDSITQRYLSASLSVSK